MLSLIVAHDNNNGIGINNTLPWNLKEDLKWFKDNTINKYVVMGSKTYFSIPEKFRPLPNRTNLVLTQNSDTKLKLEQDGVITMGSIDELVEYSRNKDVFVIGGTNIYEQTYKLVDKLYITKIDSEFECDSFFPKIDYNNLKNTFESDVYKSGDLSFTFNIYENNK